MTRGEEVLMLIQSLSKSEKRYFSLNANKNGSNKTSNHLKLFKAMNKMENYDEALLRKRLREERLLERLPVELNQLFYALLKNLKDYHYKNSERTKIRDYIFEAQLLRDRNLHQQSLNLLNKARTLARAFDDQISLLQINENKRVLIRPTSPKDKSYNFQPYITEKDEYLEKLRLEFEWSDIFYELNSFSRKGFTLQEGLIEHSELGEKYHKLREETIFSQLSYNGMHRYLQSVALFNLLNRNFVQAHQCYLDLIDWWNKHKVLKKERFSTYSIDVLNYLSACFLDKRLDHMMEMIEKVEKKKGKSSQEDYFHFRLDAGYKFLHLINTGETTAAKKMIPGIETGLKKYSLPLTLRAVVHYNILALFFLDEDYSRMIPHLYSIVKMGEHRKDLQRISRLLLILALHEDGKVETLEKQIRSSRRYFKNDPELKEDGFIHTVFKYLREITDLPDYEQKTPLTVFNNYLTQLKSNPDTRSLSGLDEFLLWARSKLTRKPPRQLLPEINQL